jgi:hypothetical protein
MTFASRLEPGFLDHPAFSIFEPVVRERLSTLDHFPEPSELRGLAHGIPNASEPWFDERYFQVKRSRPRPRLAQAWLEL